MIESLENTLLTAFVGAYLIFTSWYLMELGLGFRLLRKTLALSGPFLKLAASVTCLAVGMVVEGVSDNFNELGYLPLTMPDQDIKRRVCFKVTPTKDKNTRQISPTSVGTKLAERLAFSVYGGAHGALAQGLADSNGGEVARDKISSISAACDQVYYSAKNWCYLQSTHYDELSWHQKRIVFVRSIALTSLCLIVLWILMFVTSREQPLFFTGIVLGGVASLWSLRLLMVVPLLFVVAWIVALYLKRTRWPVTLAVIGSLWTASGAAFTYEEEQFDKRVLGYFMDNAALPAKSAGFLPAVSGMALLAGDAQGEKTYVAVVDHKANVDAPRLGLVVVSKHARPRWEYIEEPAWKMPLPNDLESISKALPNDLESICRVPIQGPGKAPNVFLLVESGYFFESAGSESKPLYGRVFAVKISRCERGWQAKLLAVHELPKKRKAKDGTAEKAEEPVSLFTTGAGCKRNYIYNFEGSVCLAQADSSGGYWLLLGHRGDGDKPGKIVVTEINDYEKPTLTKWLHEFSVSCDWRDKGTRHLSEMTEFTLDRTAVLLTSATYDGGSPAGPFKSVIYARYQIDKSETSASKLLTELRPTENDLRIQVDGFKVEGLARWPQQRPLKPRCAICTDDEALGGVCRIIEIK